MHRFISFLFILSLVSCQRSAFSPLSLVWEMGANDVEPGVCEAYLTLHNTSTDTLQNDWVLYFDLMSLHPIYEEGQPLCESEIQASYHSITPTETFAPLAPGETRTLTMRYTGNAIRETSVPEGFFIVRADGKPVSVPCEYTPFTRKAQMTRRIETRDKTPYADGEYVYTYNERILAQEVQTPLPILPQPKYIIYGTGTREYAHAHVAYRSAPMPEEAYSIRFSEDTIWIESSSEAGRFYAEQTLRQMPAEHAVCRIDDYPDLGHRGLMLDIVRNYYPADSIKRVIDVMAAYKLNVLHLHLSDDEGWRLEIPALPQLTRIGAHRGYTKDESECLLPMYNGGWDPRDMQSMANGYLTRKEFIDMLRYAHERHIRVIPEIDMPGHMRAAKKAMGGLLTDSLLEQRQYVSAQHYTDNVIAVTREEAIPFVDTIVSAIVAMYAEAQAPLHVFHIGGDEVPKGALTKEEHQTFMDGVLAILQRYNLQPAGWEEVTHFCPVESQALCYSWLNNETKPLEMAEAGYPIILATASHLYFDFAYCNHHQEKGLNWGGYTDEYSAFDWEPLHHKNIVGLNAQLWAEVIRSFQQVEWQLYPKMFGLSERAWNTRSALNLTTYNAMVYEVLLPRLAADGHAFHLQQPGIHVQDGRVEMNKVMQGGTLLYSIDDAPWQVYEGAFEVDSTARIIKAKVQYLGRESNTTWKWMD